MEIRTYQYDDASLSYALNQGKEALIERLVQDKLIDEATANKILDHYHLAAVPTSSMTQRLKKLLGLDAGTKASAFVVNFII